MTAPEYIEVIGGPLDGSRMEWVPDTRVGFTYRSGDREYFYLLKQTDNRKGEVPRRRFILEKTDNGERKGKGKKG